MAVRNDKRHEWVFVPRKRTLKCRYCNMTRENYPNGPYIESDGTIQQHAGKCKGLEEKQKLLTKIDKLQKEMRAMEIARNKLNTKLWYMVMKISDLKDLEQSERTRLQKNMLLR